MWEEVCFRETGERADKHNVIYLCRLVLRPQIQAPFLLEVHGIISQVHQQEISQHRCPKQHGKNDVPSVLSPK